MNQPGKEQGMKKLYIMKVGTTFPEIEEKFGDFDTWTRSALGPFSMEISVLDIEHGAGFPDQSECAGAVITGSHAMVTDDLSWSINLEKWILSALESGTPVLGICYGHQLLARAAGGQVGFHPHGKEIGTVSVKQLPDGETDALFRSLPRSFDAHATHAQSVLKLPPGAIHLAGNDYEPHHAFRIGELAWGVQFHPEYSADIMQWYIKAQADELASIGIKVAGLLGAVSETPAAIEICRNFARVVEGKNQPHAKE